MTQREGEWRFAFFDREPHGLFGEEVKTRNAICFYSKPLGTSQPKFLTGPLRRWTSRTRPTLFQSIEFTPLRTGIAQGIPKIDGELEATTLLRLFRRADSMESFCSSITSCLPSAASAPEQPSVFVGSTAYNFLSIARFLPEPEKGRQTENALHRLTFDSDEKAFAALAVLGSRLTYWLWHVTGDGFHVTRKFVASLPWGRSLFDASLSEFANLGQQLWQELQRHAIVSRNKGRTTTAFRLTACAKARDAIDARLCVLTQLHPELLGHLRRHEKHLIVVDVNDARRAAAHTGEDR
jgi:hypothetical protein